MGGDYYLELESTVFHLTRNDSVFLIMFWCTLYVIKLWRDWSIAMTKILKVIVFLTTVTRAGYLNHYLNCFIFYKQIICFLSTSNQKTFFLLRHVNKAFISWDLVSSCIIFLFASMIALQKWWKMIFISS